MCKRMCLKSIVMFYIFLLFGSSLCFGQAVLDRELLSEQYLRLYEQANKLDDKLVALADLRAAFYAARDRRARYFETWCRYGVEYFRYKRELDGIDEQIRLYEAKEKARRAKGVEHGFWPTVSRWFKRDDEESTIKGSLEYYHERKEKLQPEADRISGLYNRFEKNKDEETDKMKKIREEIKKITLTPKKDFTEGYQRLKDLNKELENLWELLGDEEKKYVRQQVERIETEAFEAMLKKIDKGELSPELMEKLEPVKGSFFGDLSSDTSGGLKPKKDTSPDDPPHKNLAIPPIESGFDMDDELAIQLAIPPIGQDIDEKDKDKEPEREPEVVVKPPDLSEPPVPEPQDEKPQAKKPTTDYEIVAVNADTEELTHRNTKLVRLRNDSSATIIIRVAGKDSFLGGKDAVSRLIEKGYFYRLQGVGIVATTKYDNFLDYDEISEREELEEPPKKEDAIFGKEFKPSNSQYPGGWDEIDTTPYKMKPGEWPDSRETKSILED